MADLNSVLEKIEGTRVASILSDLVQIPSDSPAVSEAKVARYVADFCSALGMETHLQEVLTGRPNVLAWLRGTEPGPTLVFNTHMDTVPAGSGWAEDPTGGVIKNGRVYGRGSADAKGALAGFLAALEALKSQGTELRGRILLATVVDEETASAGARELVKGLKCEYAIVGEPTLGRVAIAHRGSLRPILAVEGVSAHSSRPQEGINAIFRAAGVLKDIERYSFSLSEREHALCGAPTCAVTLISGGIKDNMIPDRCEITVDRRMVPGETEETALREIEEVLAQAKNKDPQLRVKVDRLLPTTGSPSETLRDDLLVETALRVGRRVLHREPDVYGMSVACDMTHFRSIGASVVVIGPGWEGVAHKPDEYVEITQLQDAARIYCGIALDLLGQR